MKTSTAFTTSAIAVVLAASLAAPGVHAHGGMTEPKPRGLTTMGLAIDNTFGFPIPMRADYTNGKGGDCINFTPDTNLQSIPVGTSKIKMRANNGANHIGPCSVFLVNPQSATDRIEVGQMNDCMRSIVAGPGPKGAEPTPAEMTINVPSSGLPCHDGHCVLQFVWEARHNIPIENYNNCADVKIIGASSGGDSNNNGGVATAVPKSTPSTSAPRPTTTMPTSVPTTPAMTPQPVDSDATETPVEPSTAPTGKYVYVGTHGDVQGMTQWCNWNCPNFCPEDLCTLA